MRPCRVILIFLLLPRFMQAENVPTPEMLGAPSVYSWLIAEGGSSDLINREWALGKVREVLRDDAAIGVICEDLKNGDGWLASAIQGGLQNMNLSAGRAAAETEQWGNGAAGNYRQAWRSSDQAAKPLLDYLLATGPNDPGLAYGLTRELGEAPTLLGKTILTTCNLAADGPALSLAERWDLHRRFSARTQGAIARILLRDGPPTTFYSLFWSEARNDLQTDPSLVSEVRMRLNEATPLYRDLTGFLVRGLESDAGQDFFRRYLRVSELAEVTQLSGRAAWLWRGLMGAEPLSRDALGPAGQRLVRRVATRTEYSDFLWWHLTRPAEAMSDLTFAGLQRNLREDEGAVRWALEKIWDAGPLWTKKLEASFAWKRQSDFLNASELRRKYVSGLDRGRILKSGGMLADFFEEDRSARSLLVASAGNELGYLDGAVREAVRLQPECARAWAQNFIGNDPAGAASLLRYVAGSSLHVRPEGFADWLKLAAAQLASEGGASSAGASTQFIDQFAGWIRTREGWKQVQSKLAFELSTSDELRQLLLDQFRQNVEGWWKVYGQATTLPAGSGLNQSVQSYVLSTGLSEDVLNAVAEWNLILADNLEPVWQSFLTDPAIIGELSSDLTRAGYLNEITALSAVALRNVLAKPEWVASLKMVVPADWESNADAREQLLTLYLPHPEFAAKWQKSILSAVLYGGQAPILARWIREKTARRSIWSRLFAAQLAREPLLLRTISVAMSGARPGDLTWLESVSLKTEAVMKIFLENQELFERLIMDKTGLSQPP